MGMRLPGPNVFGLIFFFKNNVYIMHTSTPSPFQYFQCTQFDSLLPPGLLQLAKVWGANVQGQKNPGSKMSFEAKVGGNCLRTGQTVTALVSFTIW
jgi:hypothetical protein